MIGKRKLELPLKLDLSFDEALSRFVATDPGQVDESIKEIESEKAAAGCAPATAKPP